MTGALSDADIAFVRSLLLHEDEHILAFAKPAGLTSQGGRIAAHTLDDLLAAFARSNGKRPRLAHRLDRDTSGVILAARTQPAAALLGRALMARRVGKTYLALVRAPPDPREGVIEAPLRRQDIGREAYVAICGAADAGAQAAATRYRTLSAGEAAALVELRPRTGRMHQLRVHLASRGRPILGDARYGGALVAGGIGVGRVMLHALALRFPHPAGGTMTLEAPPPADFAALRDALAG